MTMGNFMLNPQQIFTTPIALASIQTGGSAVAEAVTSGNFLFDAVSTLLLPLCWDFGKVLFAIGVIQGIYMLMRSDTKGFINKTKYATVGYICLRFIQVFVGFIDLLAMGMVDKMGLY